MKMHREGSKIELFSITMGKFNVGEKFIKFNWGGGGEYKKFGKYIPMIKRKVKQQSHKIKT